MMMDGSHVWMSVYSTKIYTCISDKMTRPAGMHVISPISEGAPYILPIFEKISLRKFSEFPIYLIYLPIWNFRSPYQNSRIPFFVFKSFSLFGK